MISDSTTETLNLLECFFFSTPFAVATKVGPLHEDIEPMCTLAIQCNLGIMANFELASLF